jgi:hypothetical protein
MEILLNKRQDILKDIEAVNAKLLELEGAHEAQINSLYELRGAQRVVEQLIAEQDQREAAALKRAAVLEGRLDAMMQSAQEEGVDLAELSTYEKDKLGFSVGDKVMVKVYAGTASAGQRGVVSEIIEGDVPYPIQVDLVNGRKEVFIVEELEHV